MAELRYLVGAKKAGEGGSSPLSGAIIGSARAIAIHPAMLFSWTGNAEENESMARMTMLMIMVRGQMNISFGESAETQLIEFLKRSAGKRTGVNLFVHAQIIESPGNVRFGSHLNVVGRVDWLLKDKDGGYVCSFADVRSPYDPTVMSKMPPNMPMPILIPFTHPLLRPPLPTQSGKPK